jgi:8-oxo-dGTP pyrophosphatase MutT (NUDIX family)
VNPQVLPQWLTAALLAAEARTLSSLAPTLSYGRHRGPAPAGVRRAAVAVVWLRRDDGSWWLPLTLRPQNLRHHGGQVCFPGGMIEAGETPRQAALREFQEELGQAPVDPLLCGELDPVYVYASNNLVFPVVFTAVAPGPWEPDPIEVDSVLEMPLPMLLNPSSSIAETRSRQIIRDHCQVGEYRFGSIAYKLQGHMIWGVTAMLLGHLAQLINGNTERGE